MYIAQKGLVFNKTNQKILTIQYLDAKHNPEKLRGKYGLPGGKMDLGEESETTLVREIKEETGIIVKPILPFYTWMWIYKKNDEDVQIVCTVWLAEYLSGEIVNLKNENETTIRSEWIDFSNLNINSFVIDEQPALEKLKEYMSSNPFKLV